ncbi:MAG: DUF3362 domain-containing protein, partial [Butyricicoccus sp.]
TCMYYTGIDPRTMQPVYVAKDPHDKALQRALLQWRKPEMRRLVIEALHKAHREDLIGYDKHCLIRPLNSYKKKDEQSTRDGKGEKHTENRGGRNAQGRRVQEKSSRERTQKKDRRGAKETTQKAAAQRPTLKPSQKRSGKNNGGKKRRG